MKNLMFFLFLIWCFLFHAEKTADFAYIGLKTWFDQMIISLFPFLVLMNLLLKTGLSSVIIRPFHLLLRPFFKNTPDAVFVIFFGFLCGFPLGCKSVTELYRQNRISKTNAQYLLSFTNNIGPAYLLGFFMGTIRIPHSPVICMLFIYGIPLLYGFVLRHTIYKKDLDAEIKQYDQQNKYIKAEKNTSKQGLICALPDAIKDALVSLSMLGGYMILFNALRIVPHVLFRQCPPLYIAAQGILEISGGLLCVNSFFQDGLLRTLCLYAVFSFNGLCCCFQTLSLLQDTPLSGQKYMLHKFVLCSITVFFVLLYEIFR